MPTPAARPIDWLLFIVVMALAAGTSIPAPLDDFQERPSVAALSASAGRGESWIDGERILGGQREMVLDGSVLRIIWDGADYAPDKLDATGLGGVDLTQGGRPARVVLEAEEVRAPVELRLIIYSDDRRVSSLRLELGAGTESRAAADLSELSRQVGGANLADVGAVVLELPASAALQLKSLRFEAQSGSARQQAAQRPKPRAQSPRGPAIPVMVVTQDGDTPPGSGGDPVTSLNAPFTNADGEVGFTGAITGGMTHNFVWFDGGITFVDSTVMGMTLSGGESTMGIGDSGQFIYSPSVDGDDAVWTHNGLLAVDGTQAPGFPMGTNSTFHSRPTMLPGGRAHWVSGFNESGGTSTEGRMLYTSPDAMPGTIAVVLRSDDLIGGFTIDRPSGIDFDYHVSDNGAHHIQTLLMDTGSTTDDDFVYVDGALVARETDPTGPGDNWDNFDSVSINDAGHYLFSGDTDGATGSDEFIAYDGTIAVREGDTIGGVTLTSSASVQALSISNLGQALHLWSISGGTEVLFLASDASDLSGTSLPLLRTGDMVDVDGNGTADATVTDFNASGVIGPGLSLAEDGRQFVEVDLDYGAGDLEAVIALTAKTSDLTIGKTVDNPGPVFGGDVLTYTIEVHNNGNAAATNVVVLDPVPAMTTYVAASCTTSQGTCSLNGANVEFLLGILNPASMATMTFQAQLDPPPLPPGTIVNENYTVDSSLTDPIAGPAVTVVLVPAELIEFESLAGGG